MGSVIDCITSLQNCDVEVLTTRLARNRTLFGDRGTEVEVSSSGRTLIQYDLCPYKKGKSGYRHTEERLVKTQREYGHLQAKGRELRKKK